MKKLGVFIVLIAATSIANADVQSKDTSNELLKLAMSQSPVIHQPTKLAPEAVEVDNSHLITEVNKRLELAVEKQLETILAKQLDSLDNDQ